MWYSFYLLEQIEDESVDGTHSVLVAFYFDSMENLSLAALNIRFNGVGLLSLQEMGVNHTLNFKDKSYLDIVPALMDKITLKSVDPLEGLRGEFYVVYSL